jgi:pyruvate ferredoxin oxidoreductase beta subunit
MTEETAVQKVKFYQTGTHTIGNRLMDESGRTVQASTDRANAITSGHRACQGCGEALGARYALDAAMRVTEGKLVAVNATGCLEVFTTPYPETSWQIPWLHSLFGNAPAVATGVAAGLRTRGLDDVRVVAQGGDGGTVDIGFGCLSGMFERNDDVLYLCYDNEAYMNTGVQRSSATPPTARTATTQALGDAPGNVFGTGKNMPQIAMAHNIPYVATASVSDLHDLEAKVTKAMGIHGARYPHRPSGRRKRAVPAFRGRARGGCLGQQDPSAGAGRRLPAAATALCASVQEGRRGPGADRRNPADGRREYQAIWAAGGRKRRGGER